VHRFVIKCFKIIGVPGADEKAYDTPTRPSMARGKEGEAGKERKGRGGQERKWEEASLYWNLEDR